MGTDAHSVAGQSPVRHEDTNDITDAPTRRAVVLVGHGGVPRDYPRERLMQLRGLEARRRAPGGAALS